jgi:regulator of protease activity HflC (stomatin/prohibitin superfamily)
MATPTRDSRVADAIDRVLQAEREMAAAIVAAGSAAEAAIAAARETRRTLLETSRQRIVRMHGRAQPLLARRLDELEAAAAAAQSLDGGELEAVTPAVVDRIAERLTTDPHA